MKKVLSHILILFIIFANLFAPLSVGLSKNNNIEVKSNIASADTTYTYTATNTATTPNTIITSAPFSGTTGEADCNTSRDNFNKNKTSDTTVSVCTGTTTPPIPGSQSTVGQQDKVVVKPVDGFPACSIWSASTWGGCVGIVLYYLFFKPTSLIFGLSGKILDFTLMYSISDTSYRSSFVVEGWGIIKDFCNMFFIFVLLYIAFGTILNLQNVKTKEMIINVVIIGLLINFSLFATQVIIDASNILTRVFYNQKTIITGTIQKDASGNPLPVVSQLGAFGEIKLSEAIVSKVDPQALVMESSKIEAVNQSGVNEGTPPPGISAGTFIIIVFLTTAINIVGTIAFTSSALIFIGRVVMLWLAMILAPLAFFSYIVPELQDIEMIGWKKWWPETLKMAFVAPVFAFFMYIIVGFMSKGLGVVGASLKTGAYGLNFLVAILVPFVFIMILLMKAKDVAVKMSGEVGAAMSKAGAAVGGLALGAATGGAALAMRGTVGRLGSVVAGSDRLQQMETRGGVRGFAAKMMLKGGAAAGAGSMDLRGVKIAGKGLSDAGLDLGKAKEGGSTKARAEHIEKRQKRMKALEVGEDSAPTQAVRQAEHTLHELKSDTVTQNQLVALNGGNPTAVNPIDRLSVTQLEGALAGAERGVADAERTLRDTVAQHGAVGPEADAARLAQANAVTTREDRRGELTARRALITGIEQPIRQAENALKTAENARNGINSQRREAYARSNLGGWSQAVNFVISGGEHSFRGEREASNKIMAGIHEDKPVAGGH